MATLRCGDHAVDLSRPVVMGILNVTPDSFYDGGRHRSLDDALARAEVMVAEGAALIDVGGESTRPGSQAVSLEEELGRVLPVVEALAPRLPVPLSVDSSKPEVMRAAADAGAGLINDVYALRRPRALETAAATGLPVCLMHMQGEPRSMQVAPRYEAVVMEVLSFLTARVAACRAAGIEGIVLDPGFGFGKSLDHNLRLLAHLERLAGAGFPVLVGVSRKSMFQQLLGRAVDERLAGGLAAAVLAAERGAAIIRTHDVAETVDVLRVREAVAAHAGQRTAGGAGAVPASSQDDPQ